MSTNISKQKRSNLINKIKLIKIHIAKSKQDENTGNLLTYLSELEKEINGKKYGLVFEEHEEEIDQKLKTHTPVLSEEEDLFINNGGQMNFLIEGDNLPTLKLLEKTHKGKIDVIYIDPPYNTGNKDFIYDDDFINKEDGFKHSKWLSFINKRLCLAKQLLSEKGLIFISIDDNEQSQLKLLCDEIFGEGNYINTISVNSKVSAGASGGGEDKRLKKNIEYILMYGKSVNAIKKMGSIYKETELMSYVRKMKEDDKSFKYTSVLYKKENIEYYKTIKDGSGSDIVISKVNNYEIKNIKQIAKIEEITEEQAYLKYYDKIMATTNAQTSIRTRVWDATDSENTMYIASYVPKSGKNKGKQTEIILMGKQKVLVIWLADSSYKTNNKIFKREKIGTYWDGFSWINVSKEGNIKFDNGKKPIKLVKQAISLYSYNKKICVLDFFAGSGTTGHAVMELNKEDGGNRKFILCTNNENNICKEITYERIKRVIAKENYQASLKYFKVNFVSVDEQLYYEYADQLLKHIRELVELENGVNFEENSKIKIILTDAELAAFSEKKIELKKCQKLYLGHDVLVSGIQEKLFKDCEIEINIIPDYYYKELES